MDILADLATTILAQLQKPTLAFLLGGMLLAALGSRLVVPDAVYKFIVIVLLLKVGMGAGMSLRDADLAELAAPALAAAGLGVAIVLLGGITIARQRGVSRMDGMATAGLFGAVSASTLAAGMAMLEDEGIAYEGFIGALYPFMDIAALVTAIVLARLNPARAAVPQGGGTVAMGGGGMDLPRAEGVSIRAILVDTFRSPAISALVLGLAVGMFAKTDAIFESFYQQLFYGLLSILMLTMGMEAWQRLGELRRVAGIYVLYGLLAPLVHGAMGLGAGLLVHEMTGFSQGGVVLLAVLAGSSSDISGPPTLKAALPEANPSAYLGTSTGLGTPVAILAIPLWIALAEMLMGA
ncbi:MAG: sodium-dependent bicarbonate transport family permease [Pseudomonadota bacterium]